MLAKRDFIEWRDDTEGESVSLEQSHLGGDNTALYLELKNILLLSLALALVLGLLWLIAPTVS
ncbi:MAG: hypothetical protein ACOX2O_02910 [Bdellovibrionota bacterium]|jgi:hypothetical protein